MEPVLDTIIKEIPAPKVDVNAPLQLQVALLDYNDFVGRIGLGTIKKGTIHEEASAGEIVAVAGLTDINVGETIGALNNVEALPPIRLDEPTLQMTFGTNSSPLSGQDGKQLTARKIEERLFRETQKDVALKVERIPNKESWIVSGRGELHLSILIENMRREGFELEVSKPQVIIKEIDGERCEPYEDLLIDVPNEFVGDIMMSLGNPIPWFIRLYDQFYDLNQRLWHYLSYL